ncbi:MAG: hypothetical protein MJK04_25525, partial [Psychrosphaera sp.]|nr:hypothetical protein [Psychrosphaera sp.]
KHLVISNDPWQMEHFRQRLPIYYPGDIQDSNNQPLPRASVAKHLLNHLALTDDSQTINECFNAIKAQVNITQRDMVVRCLACWPKITTSKKTMMANTNSALHCLNAGGF